VCICACVCVYVCVWVCVYVYVYVCICVLVLTCSPTPQTLPALSDQLEVCCPCSYHLLLASLFHFFLVSKPYPHCSTLVIALNTTQEGLLPTLELRRKCFRNVFNTVCSPHINRIDSDDVTIIANFAQASEKTCRLVEAAVAGPPFTPQQA
jgi:hypothetical protein